MSLTIPSIRADDPLGFLAAIGLASLSEQGLIPAIRIGWQGRAAPTLTVAGGVRDVQELGGALTAAFGRLRARGEVVPEVGPGFPASTEGSTTDPMRMDRVAMAAWYAEADDRWRDGDRWFARWLVALTGQSAVKDESRGDVVLTPFYAPTGRMALRTSIFEKAMDAVERVGGPADVLGRWRRTSHFAGANFDDRAERDAGVSPAGKPDSQGAPSATWLAAMGIRCFPIADSGTKADAVGWQRVRMYPGFTARSLVWPAWTPLLEPPAIRMLLAHPALRLGGTRSDPRVERGDELAALGVAAVFGSSRRTLQQGDGPLGPARRLWVAPTSGIRGQRRAFPGTTRPG